MSSPHFFLLYTTSSISPSSCASSFFFLMHDHVAPCPPVYPSPLNSSPRLPVGSLPRDFLSYARFMIETRRLGWHEFHLPFLPLPSMIILFLILNVL